MEINTLIRPESMDQAYEWIVSKKALPLGGTAWIRINRRRIETAVDLSTLDLRYIRKSGDTIELGAMASARDVETSSLLRDSFGEIFAESVSHIVGVQMRNIVSVGGTVAGRYGFSELNTLLLAMDAKVCLYKAGELDMEAFLSGAVSGPVLIEKILLDCGAGKGAFKALRNTKNDLPILDVAAAFIHGAWRIAVGARPGSACLAKKAASLLGTQEHPEQSRIEEAAALAAEELSFHDDIRGSAEYRKTLCPVLVRRAIGEVKQ